MNADVAPTMAFDTVSLNIPHADLSFLKTLVKKMGWVMNKKTTPPRQKALYDPETGKYLNDETMKVIEDAENGIGLVPVGSFEDYLKFVENL